MWARLRPRPWAGAAARRAARLWRSSATRHAAYWRWWGHRPHLTLTLTHTLTLTLTLTPTPTPTLSLTCSPYPGKGLDKDFDLTKFAQPFINELTETDSYTSPINKWADRLGKATGLNSEDVDIAISQPRKVRKEVGRRK